MRTSRLHIIVDHRVPRRRCVEFGGLQTGEDAGPPRRLQPRRDALRPSRTGTNPAGRTNVLALCLTQENLSYSQR